MKPVRFRSFRLFYYPTMIHCNDLKREVFGEKHEKLKNEYFPIVEMHIESELRRQHYCRIDTFCRFSQSNFQLSYEMVMELAEKLISLGYNVSYPHGRDRACIKIKMI